MFKNLIFYFSVIIPAIVVAQKNDTSLYIFRVAEQELLDIQNTAFYSRIDAEKTEANKKMIAVWDRIVVNPKILDYPFSNLKKDVSVLEPKNKKFKLITWNIAKNDGTYAFFGYLLVNNSKRIKKGLFKHETIEAYEYFKLLDRSALVKYPESHVGGPDKWFGMLYTALIECNGYYTLIGWDGNDKITRRKFVDVLYFKSDGSAVFGKDVFKFPRKNPKRLMFECSSDITMSVKYNEKKNQIIYDHLGPNQEGNEGQFQYYGPDGSHDALEMKNDKWVTVEDVDARGEKNKNDNAAKPDKKHKKLMPQAKSK